MSDLAVRAPGVTVAIPSVIAWLPDGVRLLDQTELPERERYLDVRSIDDMVGAIQRLSVRGAPLIGIAAAMALAGVAGGRAHQGSLDRAWFEGAAEALERSRPTGVNLRWAIERLRNVARGAFASGDQHAIARMLREEAQRIWDEDAAMCRAIGEAGASLLGERARVLTHCNAGALATGGIGTALAPVYVARARGATVEVFATETRPLRQGARLTAWELARSGVAVTVVADGAAAGLMARGEVDLVLTGADRIAANGDVANKIGTYSLAVLARAHGVPFYVAAPSSTFDVSLEHGGLIPIEERDAAEIPTAPGAAVSNPAFDVTPSDHVAGIVTEQAVLRPPYGAAIRALVRDSSASRD